MTPQKRIPFVAAILVTAVACQSQSPGDAPHSKAVAPAVQPPKLEMFVMSQCPYGVQVLDAIAPVKEQLGSALDLRIGYIGEGAPGNFNSLHGPTEVKGNIAQLCAAAHAPDKYLALIVCQNKNPRAVDTNWKDCAGAAGIDVAALTACIEGDEGQQLLGSSFAEAKQRGVEGSPTMFLNGAPYEGGRKTRDFLRAVCQAVQGEAPEACRTLPQPPAVHAIFFSDKRCAECNVAPLEPRIKSEYAGLEAKFVDYMTDEGKALYRELTSADPSFKLLPTILLDGAEAEKDAEGFAALKGYMRPLGKYQALQLEAQFDPTAEICDNGIDDDGDNVVDCAEESCKQALTCRPVKPGTLDLFVMSQCPYGAQALIAAKDVVDHFGKDLTLNVHFIGAVQGDTLASLHGQSEVDEDIREICAIANYGKDHQFMKYLGCRSKDYRNPTWQPCAKEAGMDEKVIQRCFDGEGKDLLRKSFTLATELEIAASPTFLSNNRRPFNAVDAATIQRQFCTDNPSVGACGTEVKSTAPRG